MMGRYFRKSLGLTDRRTNRETNRQIIREVDEGQPDEQTAIVLLRMISNIIFLYDYKMFQHQIFVDFSKIGLKHFCIDE